MSDDEINFVHICLPVGQRVENLSERIAQDGRNCKRKRTMQAAGSGRRRHGEQETLPLMKIRPAAAVSKSVERPPAVAVLQNRAHCHFYRLVRIDQCCCGKIQGQTAAVSLLLHREGQGGQRGFFPHSGPILGKSIDIPIAGQRQVDFPILGQPLRRDEKFKAGALPETIFAAGSSAGNSFLRL